MESNVLRILPFFLPLINWIRCGDALPATPSLYCADLNPQNNVDIEQVRLTNSNSFDCYLHQLIYSIIYFQLDPRNVVWK